MTERADLYISIKVAADGAITTDIKSDAASPSDVVMALASVIGGLICAQAPSRLSARAGARALGKDLVTVVNDLWDEGGPIPEGLH